jgi:hypothetical protein
MRTGPSPGLSLLWFTGNWLTSPIVSSNWRQKPAVACAHRPWRPLRRCNRRLRYLACSSVLWAVYRSASPDVFNRLCAALELWPAGTEKR